MNFKLQNRYQDSGWEDISEEFDCVDEAVWSAAEKSSRGIVWGMVRVIDKKTGEVVIEFPAE